MSSVSIMRGAWSLAMTQTMEVYMSPEELKGLQVIGAFIVFGIAFAVAWYVTSKQKDLTTKF